jgi:hypothetical protein
VEVCHEVTAEREMGVVLAWAAPDRDEQARRLERWGMTDRGAALRDTLTAVPVENVRRLLELAAQARGTKA